MTEEIRTLGIVQAFMAERVIEELIYLANMLEDEKDRHDEVVKMIETLTDWMSGVKRITASKGGENMQIRG